LTKINIGILGASDFAIRAILPEILSPGSEFNLVGIATRSYAGLQSLQFLKDTRFFKTYDELIECDDVTAVYIPLPNSLHFAYALKSLKQGKHVLVEKPAVLSRSQATILSEVSSAKGLALMEDFHFLHHEQLAVIRDILASNQIGEVKRISSCFSFNLKKTASNIRLDPKLGGGALLDAGVYPLRLARALLGSELEIKYLYPTWFDDAALDSGGTGLLVCKKSMIPFQFSYGFDRFYECSLEILGTSGRVVSERIFTCPPSVEPPVWLQIGGEKTIVKPDVDNAYKKMLKRFHAAIFDQSIKALELVNILEQSELLENALEYLETTQPVKKRH
jgi:NDP-hexose-3-ketoreductase